MKSAGVGIEQKSLCKLAENVRMVVGLCNPFIFRGMWRLVMSHQ